MQLLDSRRLTGPGLVLDRPGAVADVEWPDGQRDALIAAWRDAATRMLRAVGWGDERAVGRRFTGGASLAITAPPDSLYAATDLNEWAWAAAEAALDRRPEPDFGAAAERLRERDRRRAQPRPARHPGRRALARAHLPERRGGGLGGRGHRRALLAGRASSRRPRGSTGRGRTRSLSPWSPARTARPRWSGCWRRWPPRRAGSPG